MKCGTCGVYAQFQDGFCSACGVEMPESRLPVKRENIPVPSVWQQAAPVVARGAALVVAGIAAEWLLRTVARSATGSPSSTSRKSAKKSRAVAKPEVALFEEIVAVSRTVVTRRVVVRR
jgi:hypothetical protein